MPLKTAPEIVRDKYISKIMLIENDKNLGFAEGNNVAYKKASGEFVALLNNDAVADNEWLYKLISAVNRCDPLIRNVGIKNTFYDNHKMIDTLGHLIYPDGLNRGRGKGELDTGQYNKEEEVFYPERVRSGIPQENA